MTYSGSTPLVILPWVYSKGLASKILAMAAKQVILDWKRSFNYSPLLHETFVEKIDSKGLPIRLQTGPRWEKLRDEENWELQEKQLFL